VRHGGQTDAHENPKHPATTGIAMKAAPFSYVRVDSVDQALGELAEHGDACKLLAGGQSLVPMMSMRLVRSSRLVDIYRITELQALHVDTERVITAAGVRQHALEGNARLAERLPLVAKGLRWVGHQQTRNRGTVGGSLVHADPSAELPLCAAMLDARFTVLKKATPARTVEARDFFLGPMYTTIRADELLSEIHWPVWSGGGVGAAFDEVAIRHGDFAMASGAAQVQLDAGGVCRRAVIGAGGVGGVPMAFPTIAERLVGKLPSEDLIRSVAADAANATEPGSDMHASENYRRHLVKVLLQRVLNAAIDDARKGNH
jgi:CO/xanthine dehydrogenase FAD-binding subunit